MTSRALRRTAALVAALLLTACSGEGEPSGGPSGSASAASPGTAEEACQDVVDGVVAVTQQYVDRYGAAAGAQSPGGGAQAGPAPDLQKELARARGRLQAMGCEAARTGEQLTVGLEGLEARGPLAEALKRRLVASMTGRVGPSVVTRRVGADDDLREVLPTLASGSTVRLAAGEHRLPDTVVLLQGVRLVGAGRGRTTLTSSASGAALLAVTPERVDLRHLTVRHVGDEPASVVVGGSSTALALDDVTVVGGSGASGPRSGRAGTTGGSGVLLAGGKNAPGSRRTTLQVTDSVFRNNDAAGILLSGDNVARVVDSRFLDGGQCGVCFVGTTSGLVRDSEFRGGVTGVIAADRAAPLLVGLRVAGAEIGVQAVDRASPVVRRTTVSNARRASLLFSDQTRGRVESVTCRESSFGIVVAPRAVPFLGENRCAVQPMG